MRSIFLAISLMSIFIINAQTPELMPYQAIVRNNSGQLITEQDVSVRFNIIQSSVNGEVVYSEKVSVKTSETGVINTLIGSGESLVGSMKNIDWSDGPYFLEISYDLLGGDTFVPVGTTQLVSVPFTLYAKTAEKTVSKTKLEREAMSSISIGQLLFCTDCGTNGELQVYNGIAWTNMLGEAIVE